MRRCPDQRCGAPTLSCRMGEDALEACPIWNKGAGDVAASTGVASSAGGMRLPWSGAALGTAGLAFFAGRADARLVAMIGPHNAGKTTLLGLFYQHLGRIGGIGTSRFAGSYSLEGWEAIAHALRWSGNTPRFPPHTSSGAGRIPGLLHMALRGQDGRLSDALFADSPGEWFQRWTIDPSANDAEGARWVVERAATLLVVADCEALAGKDRGGARNDIIQLLRRVATVRNGRPVALVWTKADIAVPPLIRAAVSEAAQLVMPDVVAFHTSVVEGEQGDERLSPIASVAKVLEWLVAPAKRGFAVPQTPTASRDPFFVIGEAA